MEDIFEKILEVQKGRKGSALVTVTRTEGSTPRNAGSKMIVFADGEIFGSVGGSVVEALVVEKAKECIRSGKCVTVSHDLEDPEEKDTGMVCGGMMDFFIEPLNTAPHLFLFGAGHVAVPVASMAHQVGFEYTIIDDREVFANQERFPDAREIVVEDLEKYAEALELRSSDFVVIMTRGHVYDYHVAKGIIKKSCRYVGMIGSESKRKETFAKLREDGISEDLLKRVHTPIGLEIRAETPEEIAVSILAEMIKVKYEG